MPVHYMNIINNKYEGQDDNNFSEKLINELNRLDSAQKDQSSIHKTNIDKMLNDSLILDNLYHSNNIRQSRNDVMNISDSGGNIFTHTFRFGLSNPYGAISSAREFLFFTKPDLHIIKNVSISSNAVLNDGLGSYFWKDMLDNKKRIISCLQGSYNNYFAGSYTSDPFNHLLQNTVVSNLDVPGLNSNSIETSTNTFGVSISYRGSSEDSDDNPEFSLEFKDDRYLNVYTFFRAYEEYETLKKHGLIEPQANYRKNKIINDQFAIYKIIVDEDMETILYWGKYYGVYPVSLPRDAFNSPNFQDGISFTINFKAAFYEDMRPEILYDFNALTRSMWNNKAYHRIDIYNDIIGRIDGRLPIFAYVERVEGDLRAQQNPNRYYYKLAWKGDDTY